VSTAFADVTLAADSDPTSRNPRSVLIRQREYRQDAAMLSIDYEPATAAKYSTGSPVLVEWGWLPEDTNVFYGYVHHTRQETNQQKAQMLRVYCVGATYRMKQPGGRTFTNATTKQVASTIAAANGFSLTCYDDGVVWPQLAQGGRSDWAFLEWLCRRKGYVLTGNKTQLMVLQRRISSATSVPTFTVFPGRYVQRQALYTVAHAVGDSTPGAERHAQVVAGVSDDGSVVTATLAAAPSTSSGLSVTAPVFSQINSDRPVVSTAGATDLLAGAIELQRFSNHATATVSGNTKLAQGTTVRLVGTDANSDGYWYVGGVDHMIEVDGYTCSLDLARDSVGDAGAAGVMVALGTGRVAVVGSEVGVEVTATSAPTSTYNPVSAAVPIEDAVRAAQASSPLGVVGTGNSSPARSLVQVKRVPYRLSGGSEARSAQTNLALWQAQNTRVVTPA
jgi:phage protein D